MAARASKLGLPFLRLLARKVGRDDDAAVLALLEHAVSLGLCACGHRYVLDFETDIAICPACGQMMWLEDYLRIEESLEHYAWKLADTEVKIAIQTEAMAQKLRPKVRQSLRQLEKRLGRDVAVMVGIMRYWQAMRKAWERELDWRERDDGRILRHLHNRRRRLMYRAARQVLLSMGLSYLAKLLSQVPEDEVWELYTGRVDSVVFALRLLNRWHRMGR